MTNKLVDEDQAIASSSGILSGGRSVADALAAHEVDRIFCVPGESYLEVLDALFEHTEIDVVTCRHEGAAANMAEADGKLTRKPGICLVTRGPGATHASVGVHTAFQDSTPLILFIGQIERGLKGRGAFQEVDYSHMFSAMSKAVIEIDAVDRIPELIARAFSLSISGRPGPVIVSLPEDVLCEATARERMTTCFAPSLDCSASYATAVSDFLEQSERPLVILGGGAWGPKAQQYLKQFVEAYELPVALAFRRQDAFDNLHPNYIGHLGLGVNPMVATFVQQADLLLVLGARLDDLSTSTYSLIRPGIPSQRLIHVYPDPDEIGRVYQPRLAIYDDGQALVKGLAGLPGKRDRPWRESVTAGHENYLRFSDPGSVTPPERGVNLAEIVAIIGKEAKQGAIITNGAGNYTVWLHRFFRFRVPHSQLAPTSGAMGYGLPAAIAAKLRYPDREVICFAGDGCFLMYPQELGTALQNDAAIIVIIVNNGRYGTIRMHQERRFPGRVIATDITNPDYQLLGKALGAHCERVELTSHFAGAFERAKQAKRPALIELVVDPDQITPSWHL